MAKKITLKHALPCGEIATRTTAREYSHVVIVREDLVALRASRDVISKVDLDNFRFYSSLVAAGAGNHYLHNSGSLSAYPVTQADFDKAQAAIGGHADAQAYADACRLARLAKHDELWGDATRGPWGIVGWCGRLDLATKLAAQQRGYNCRTDVQVEAVNNGER
ncbi:hypothetical protein [Pseudomonas alloputida]|uniref:hypothetical protein n=1 Tax=Pseudomonas alloputida TaxID=1940621 RepID=UPI00386F6813